MSPAHILSKWQSREPVAPAQNCDTPVLRGTLGSALTVSAVLWSSDLSVESASLVLVYQRSEFVARSPTQGSGDCRSGYSCTGHTVSVCVLEAPSPSGRRRGLSQSRALPRPPLILRISEDLLRNTPVPQVTAVTQHRAEGSSQRHSWVLSPWPQTPFSGKTNLP